ncbi:MAG: phosphatidylserine decarboxylase [Planctomycetes bacterium]|nr:phosphatidylserine decarboxylase [Planctomycetota bacterium]
MPTPILRAMSLATGWFADCKLPRPLRSPLYRAYSSAYRVDLSELRLSLADHPSFAAFFVRRLKDGARPFPADPRTFPSPCDGTFQSFGAIENGSILQAKGRPYPVEELLALAPGEHDFTGGHAWTIYLSPRDYHRVHSPVAGRLEEVRWCDGARYSVAPKVLERRPKVLSINERAVLRLSTEHGPLWLVMVGALNVGRIRVVGVEPGAKGAPRRFERGEELARFEMGSTVVLVAPRGGPKPLASLALARAVRMGEPIGRVE